MSRILFTHIRQRLVQAPELPWSARHSQQGCQGAREAGAAPPAPHGAAPPPVSTVVDRLPQAFPLSDARAVITAVLTTFEGQAVLRIVASGSGVMRCSEIFRLRKGCRIAHRGGPRS